MVFTSSVTSMTSTSPRSFLVLASCRGTDCTGTDPTRFAGKSSALLAATLLAPRRGGGGAACAGCVAGAGAASAGGRDAGAGGSRCNVAYHTALVTSALCSHRVPVYGARQKHAPSAHTPFAPQSRAQRRKPALHANAATNAANCIPPPPRPTQKRGR